MLEPDALKGARPVLRGGGGGDLTSLPDYGKAVKNSLGLVPDISVRRENRSLGNRPTSSANMQKTTRSRKRATACGSKRRSLICWAMLLSRSATWMVIA